MSGKLAWQWLFGCITSGTALIGFAVVASPLVAGTETTSADERMTARVDALLADRWKQAGVEPVAPAADAEFLRRASLDLTGVIPTVSEVREFLADGRPNKRTLWIDRLLHKPTHASHLAATWRQVLLPSGNDIQRFGGSAIFQTWLRGKFADNVPYDRIVTELLTASGNLNESGPTLFYTSLELKPEELAANTSRIFLGVQIQCAQCHNHPFDHWKKQDFWGYAAFFARLQQPPAQQQIAFQVVDTDKGEVKLPGSDEPVLPQFLGGQLSTDEGAKNRRARLAAWLTSADNPYFARATVNRVWGQLFGRGLVHPIDDLGEHNPPSHPELLNELAQYFIESGFDLQRLFRLLVNTRAYQLASAVTSDAQPQPELFSRMAIKSMSAEQLYDCLVEAMRKRQDLNAAMMGNGAVFAGQFNQDRQTFLARFQAPTQGASEFQASIPQALTLMNGRVMFDATDLEKSDLLVALKAPFLNDDERVEVLFLSTLSRLPRDQERSMFVEYVRSGGPTKDSRRALGDALWALLNSAEFVLNH
jgi:hypothetical protein